MTSSLPAASHPVRQSGGSEPWDAVVVGGGIVGLATARALLAGDSSAEGLQRVLVVEREAELAAHQTGHNSGVVHSGLYYRPGSLKAQLCVAGREAMFRYCEERNIPHERCGKLVVAVEEQEIPALETLHERGVANGLEGLERLDAAGIRAREPEIRGVAGLWVPQTGIVDYRQVARALARDVEAAGGTVRTGVAVAAVRRAGAEVNTETLAETSAETVVETRAAAGPAEALRCRLLVGCAGLWSDRLARAAGLEPSIRIVPFRGEYYELVRQRRHLVRHLVYPVPDPRLPFLGVHFTRTVHGGVEAGPNAVLALARDGYRWRTVRPRDLLGTLTYPGFLRLAWRYGRTGLGEVYRSLSRRAFHRALRRLMPELRLDDLVPAGAGVRAQALRRDGSLVDDFEILEGRGQIHVLNAPSPAATASLAIGAEIARRARSVMA